MPILEWSNPFTIYSPFGNLLLNVPDGNGRVYRTAFKKCTSRRGIRASSDPIPQGDGEVFHDRYANGYEIVFAVELWDGDKIACDAALVEMADYLSGVLWSLLRPIADGGRVQWTPSGQDSRLLDAVRLLALQEPELSEEGATEIGFTLDSPFPYFISAAESLQNVSGTATIPNAGNVPFYPVFKVNGSTSGFTITNNDVIVDGAAIQYVYDAGRPGAVSIGGASYGEIDMFRGGIIYLNGDETNLKGGIDVEETDVLYVEPGGNSFTISGADMDVLGHDAFV